MDSYDFDQILRYFNIHNGIRIFCFSFLVFQSCLAVDLDDIDARIYLESIKMNLLTIAMRFLLQS